MPFTHPKFTKDPFKVVYTSLSTFPCLLRASSSLQKPPFITAQFRSSLHIFASLHVKTSPVVGRKFKSSRPVIITVTSATPWKYRTHPQHTSILAALLPLSTVYVSTTYLNRPFLFHSDTVPHFFRLITKICQAPHRQRCTTSLE